jgi:hypothetical protein
MGITRHSTTTIYQFKELEYKESQFGWYTPSFHNRHHGALSDSHPYTTIFNLDTGEMTVSSPAGVGVGGSGNGQDQCSTAWAGYSAATLKVTDQDGDAGFADNDPWFFFLGYNYNYEWFFEVRRPLHTKSSPPSLATACHLLPLRAAQLCLPFPPSPSIPKHHHNHSTPQLVRTA